MDDQNNVIITAKDPNEFNGAGTDKLLGNRSQSHSRSGFEVQSKEKKPLIQQGPTVPTWKIILGYVDRFFMLWMLGIVIPLSAVKQWGHNEGPLYPQITSSWIVTIILFFGIGLGIKIEYLTRAFLFWQMILFSHFIIFVYWPVLGWSMRQLALMFPEGTVSNTMERLLTGIIILCTLPATAASATVFTINAGGNEAASAVNCTISNLLAIFLTPGLILIFTGGETEIDAANVFMNLSLRVVAPFFVAQIIRFAVGAKGRKKIKIIKPIIKKINETSLLYMVFCALSQSFYVGIEATIADTILFLFIIEIMHIHGYFAIWFMGILFRMCFTSFDVYDKVACVYTGVSKSIAMGVPFIEIIYSGDPYVGFYLLPILCYHPSNLIWGSIACEPLKALMRRSGDKKVESTLETSVTGDLDYGALAEHQKETAKKEEDVYN